MLGILSGTTSEADVTTKAPHSQNEMILPFIVSTMVVEVRERNNALITIFLVPLQYSSC
jgi:hypothetical protein